jgi:hypothetical protein
MSSKLIDKIFSIIPTSYIIELYVFDANGDLFLVYKGEITALTTEHVKKVLHEPGSFYTLTVVGVEKNLLDSPSLEYNNIIRKEFGWATGKGFSTI